MNNVEAFEMPPFQYDLVISHPFLSQLLISDYFKILMFGIFIVSVVFAINMIRNNNKRTFPFIVCILYGCIVASSVLFTPFIIKARKPISITIIAGMIVDKAIVNYGIFKNYYFITDINNERFAVKTTKQTYNLKQYSKYATFDYSLYTYFDNNKIYIYRFFIPEFKVKAEPGNLQ